MPSPADYRRSPRVHQLKAQFRLRALPTTEAGWLDGNTRRKTTPVPGVRAQSARARRSRAVFRLPVGAAHHVKAVVPPRKHPPVRFRGLAGRGIAPAARRLAGCCTPVRSSVAGRRRRLWPQANRRRRGGQGDLAAGHPYRESGPQGRVREADSSRGRGAERPRAAVARSALRASAKGILSGFRPFGPGRMATPYGESKGGLWPSLNARRRSAALAAGEERIYARAGRLSPSCPSLVPFLGTQERNSLSVDYRQALRPRDGISNRPPGREGDALPPRGS